MSVLSMDHMLGAAPSGINYVGEGVDSSSGSKGDHQALAMLHATSIRHLYSESAKQKARRDVIHHLRASLAQPAATGKSETQQHKKIGA